MTEPRTPADTAAHMIKTYGRDRAYEYASGYASGAYYETSRKAYWRRVIKAMDAIPKDKK